MRARPVFVTALVVSTMSACATAAGSQEPQAAAPRSRVFDRSPEVNVWISGDRVFRSGDRVRAYVRTEDDSYVMVFRLDTDGRFTVLYPDHPSDNTYLRGGETRLASRFGRESFFVGDDYSGAGYVFAVASWEPFDVSRISDSYGWDLHPVGGRIRTEAFTAMHEFAERILRNPQSDYALDYAQYYVERRLRYSYSDYDRRYYDQPYHNRFGIHFSWPYYAFGFGYRSCGNYWPGYYYDELFFNSCRGYRVAYLGGSRVVYARDPYQRSRFKFKSSIVRTVATSPTDGIERRRRLDGDDSGRPGIGKVQTAGTGRRVRDWTTESVRDGDGRYTNESDGIRVDRGGLERRRAPGDDSPDVDEAKRVAGSTVREPRRDTQREPRSEEPWSEPRREPGREPRVEPRGEPRDVAPPRREPRAQEPRNEPRAQPRNEPRAEPRGEPRAEPRRDPQSSGAASGSVGRRKPDAG